MPPKRVALQPLAFFLRLLVPLFLSERFERREAFLLELRAERRGVFVRESFQRGSGLVELLVQDVQLGDLRRCWAPLVAVDGAVKSHHLLAQLDLARVSSFARGRQAL